MSRAGEGLGVRLAPANHSQIKPCQRYYLCLVDLLYLVVITPYLAFLLKSNKSLLEKEPILEYHGSEGYFLMEDSMADKPRLTETVHGAG